MGLWRCNISDFVAFKNALMGGEMFTGMYHKLMNDIDLTGITFSTTSIIESYNGHMTKN